MSVLDFLGLAMKDTLHHRSRIIGSILGTIIAISFITASVISVDSISGEYFKSEMEKRSYHYIVTKEYMYDPFNELREGIPVIDVDRYAQNISEIDGIETVEGYAISNFQFMNQTTMANVMGITNETSLPFFGREITLPTEAYDVIIPNAMADRMGLKKGDSFNMTFWQFYIIKTGGPIVRDEGPQTINLTFTVHDLMDTSGSGNNFGYGGFYTIVTGMEGLRSLVKDLFTNATSTPSAFHQYMEVSISPGYLKHLDDPETTQSDVKKLTREIGTSVKEGDYKVTTDRVQDIYSDYISWSWTMRIIFVVLTIPLLLISFYLLSAGSKVGMDDRIREIGLLKIKGASRGQVVTILLMESVIFGIIGGTLGLLAGSALSSVFNARIFGMDPFEDIIHGKIPLPGLPLVIFAFVGVPLLILLMRIAVTVRLSKLPLLESLGRANVVEAQKRYKPLRDIILLTVTLLIIGLMFYFNVREPSGFLGRLVYGLLFIISPLTVLFLPFILILTFSRVMIMGFDFILDILANVGRVIVKELHPIVKANMRFHRKRIATLTILVTAVIAFGILISSMGASRLENVERAVSASIPTDLLVLEDGNRGHDLENISSIGSIGSVIEVDSHSWVSISASDMFMFGSRLVTLDSANYTGTIDLPDNVVLDGVGPEGLLASGMIPILINDAFRAHTGLSTSDRVQIMTGDREIDLRIVGIVSYLPGTRSTINDWILSDPDPRLDLDYLGESDAIYMDINKLPRNFTPVMRAYLVDVVGNEDEAISALNGMSWNGTSHMVLSRSQETRKMREDTTFTSVEMLLDMEYAFVIVAVTAGVLLFMIVSTASRRREFAELIARGSTRKHVLRLVLTEGTVVLLAGLILGTTIGMLTAFTFQHLYTENLFENLPSMTGENDDDARIDLGTAIVFPPSILFLHCLTAISVLAASLLTSWLASKVDIASSLRLRTS